MKNHLDPDEVVVESKVGVQGDEATPKIKGPACRQDDETYDECVSRKIPELIEMDGMEQDQAIAVARSMCEIKCSDKEKGTIDPNTNREEPHHDHDHGMSEVSFDLSTATSISDQSKWDDLGGSAGEVEVHYRMITPFSVEKGIEGSDDVKITGPVYVGNAEMLDRHNELVDMSAIMEAWKSYSKNPVILYNHSKTYGVIGRMTGVKSGEIDGVGVPIGTAIIDGGEKDITRKIRKGFLKAFSIGFIAKAAVKICEDEDNCYMKFTQIDWVETSVVDVPASPNALFSVTKSVVVGDHACGCGGDCCDETPDPSHPESKIMKERVGEDQYTTPAEAEARAEELDCSGSHTHDRDGEIVYMPCSSMDAYRAAVESTGEPVVVDDDDQKTVSDLMDDIISRLSVVEDKISDAQDTGSGDSVKNPLAQSKGSMDTDETPVEIDQKIAEATEEESAPVIDEVVETIETTEEIVVEEKSVEPEAEEVPMPKPSEVLLEIGNFMKSLDERLTTIEAKFVPEDTGSDDLDLVAALAEKDATIAEMVAEKEAAEAAEALEAEIQTRVDAVLAEKGVKAPSRKSIIAPVAAKSGVSRFDPQPIVSKGTNGLANWLEVNLSRRA